MLETSIIPYGAFKLYGLSARGLYRGPDWRLIREFEPDKLYRIRSACERMTTDQAGYALFLLDESARTDGDWCFERWAWELINQAERKAVAPQRPVLQRGLTAERWHHD